MRVFVCVYVYIYDRIYVYVEQVYALNDEINIQIGIC